MANSRSLSRDCRIQTVTTLAKRAGTDQSQGIGSWTLWGNYAREVLSEALTGVLGDVGYELQVVCGGHNGDVAHVQRELGQKGLDIIASVVMVAECSDREAVSEIMQTRSGVLIIDDNTDAAAAMKWLLQSFGAHPQVEHDGRSGISNAAILNPEVVLLDIGMPGMDTRPVASSGGRTDRTWSSSR